MPCSGHSFRLPVRILKGESLLRHDFAVNIMTPYNILCVDLKKAYDSAPRPALWAVLEQS